jgi:uncharacterized glyoxalase superfamily metalloenzyme YdcJ
VFDQFPDTWEEIRAQGLAYFRYFVLEPAHAFIPQTYGISGQSTLTDLITQGDVGYEPIVYEDFLPASAAGIFQSNLVESASTGTIGAGQPGGPAVLAEGAPTTATDELSSREVFESALGGRVAEYWELYEAMERESIDAVGKLLGFALEVFVAIE